MNVTVAVYQRRDESGFTWVTVGLGPQTRRRAGANPTKLQRKLIDDLRNAVAAAPAQELPLFRMPQGLRLERVRLELSLRGEAGHRRASGLFPLVVETRWRTAREPMAIAYHPEHQDEWFPLREDEPLEGQATAFFSHAWAELSEEAISALQSLRKDSLKVVSFVARPKSLLERIGKKKGPWDDLEPVLRGGALPKKTGRYRVLDKLGTNLTQQAIEGTLEGGMARSPYREQLNLLLGSERKTPVLLVGPPGVGKRTLLKRWAMDQLEADGFVLHRNVDQIHEAWEISGKRIIAGMSYVGDWEKRCLDLLDDARSGRRVLIAEDLHAFGRIGRSRESDANLALFFQGPLARGELALAGACTPEQLQRLEAEAPSFAALFTVLPVRPTTADDTMRMLLHEARRLEARHAMVFDPPIFPLLLEHAGALWGASAFPGRALRTLRQVGADYEAGGLVSEEEMLGKLSTETGLPDFVIDKSYGLRPQFLEEELAGRVMGQGEAVATCRDLILKIRAGLTDPRRPWGALLFAGPTGTGKTELAKALASCLYGEDARLLRFDMSEYQGPDAAARLCGDASDPEGALVRAVRSQPFCVVLLDEIEKAHPSALHLLLQILDDGRLSDAAGDTADFTHAVVVMTSNLGARSREAAGFGEDGADDARLDSDRAVREFFPPELFNRIDRIVHFRPLEIAVAERVAQKELARLLARPGLASRNVFVSVADEVRALAVQRAFDVKMGARSLKRWLEEELGARLAEALVRGPPAFMRRAEVYVRDGALQVEVEPLVTREPVPGRLALEPMLKASPEEILDALREERARLVETASGGAMAGLAERMRFHLEHREAREHADAAYQIDLVRERLGELGAMVDGLVSAPREAAHDLLEAQQFGTMDLTRSEFGEERVRILDRRALPPAARTPSKTQLLDALAELHFARKTLVRAADPSRHTAALHLARFGAARSNLWDDFAFIRWLAGAYAKGRGALESFAARRANGTRLSGDAREFAAMLPRNEPLEEIALRIGGFGALDFFEGEQGLHAWQSLGRLPQLVQVRVRGGEAGAPVQLLDEAARSREVWRQARAEGRAGVADPDAPLPMTRIYRFEPSGPRGTASLLEVEDHELGWATSTRAKTPADALPDLWRLRMSREDA